MTESLDTILSGRETASAQETTEQTVTQAATEATADTGEGQTQQTTEAEGESSTAGQKMVPHEALHAEKQKVKRYTEEVSSLRQEIAQRDAAWERRIAQLMEAQKPKQEPQAPPDFYENPEAATQHHVQRTVAPQFDQITQTLMANAQIVAGIKYGDDKVADAEKAFIEAMQAKTLDPADYQKVVNSPNRYAAAVQWHQKQTALREIGDDPASYRAKVEAEILAKHGLTPETAAGGETQQRQQPVMPSNLATARNVAARSGPAWGGPTALKDIFKR